MGVWFEIVVREAGQNAPKLWRWCVMHGKKSKNPDVIEFLLVSVAVRGQYACCERCTPKALSAGSHSLMHGVLFDVHVVRVQVHFHVPAQHSTHDLSACIFVAL